ncbi:helix-turn-helix domain-containing protein [Phocaeicola vulgatus]|uniref:helix-turn-helix domain-containing protein n=1 Tax=Phocaeicola vulgatus TaxID=821 RepID=UPI003AB224A5
MSERIYTAKDEAVRLFFSQCRLSIEMSEQLIKGYKPMLMNRRFVTDAQLSENLNISRRTLQDYRDKGKIPFYRLDGKILYDESDIESFLSELYRPKFED